MKLSEQLHSETGMGETHVPDKLMSDWADRIEVLEKYAQRMTTLAVKWVDTDHQDWPEIKKLIEDMKIHYHF